MTEYVWKDLLTEEDEQVISKAGYDQGGASSWETRELGDSPLVLVIDMQRLIVGEDEPILNAVESHRTAMGEIAWDAIDRIAPFLSTARDHDIPVAYTRLVPPSYDDPDHEDLAIVDPVAPEPGDPIINKSHASAFYGTDLLSQLIRRDIDTLIVVGNSTSGCVRATVVDAQQRGFDVALPQECLFDRIEASHKIALLDMWMKYASVLESEEVESYLQTINS
ncbi:isochorismatase family protein (plasmid) [Natrinema zhouii]|uniref:isochorismatase family protein n=1 Tax=Natrinema zhouii TaxID=1710539 RepID=UPI001CFF5494|nr:isochorismatase family protein [Natrinema zhouii]UHQ98852.1 isochorismatase family protein [Natrinema zhouii]